MKVRQLVGRLAGHIIDMPKTVAETCIANGTAAHIGREPRIRGLTLQPVAPKPEAVKMPALMNAEVSGGRAQPAAEDRGPMVEAVVDEDETATEDEAAQEPVGNSEVGIVIPEDWREFSAVRRKWLASQIAGEKFARVADADAAIEAHLAQ